MSSSGRRRPKAPPNAQAAKVDQVPDTLSATCHRGHLRRRRVPRRTRQSAWMGLSQGKNQGLSSNRAWANSSAWRDPRPRLRQLTLRNSRGSLFLTATLISPPVAKANHEYSFSRRSVRRRPVGARSVDRAQVFGAGSHGTISRKAVARRNLATARQRRAVALPSAFHSAPSTCRRHA